MIQICRQKSCVCAIECCILRARPLTFFQQIIPIYNISKNNQVIINNTITPTWNRIVAEMPKAVADDLLFLSGDEAVFGYKEESDARNMKDRLLALQFPSYIVITVFRLEQKFIEKKNYFLRHFSYPEITTDIKAAGPDIVRQAMEELRNKS